ncbi:hypothetical protein PENTCL1PPCAC_29408, partial [Pristionchus entomophagus]
MSERRGRLGRAMGTHDHLAETLHLEVQHAVVHAHARVLVLSLRAVVRAVTHLRVLDARPASRRRAEVGRRTLDGSRCSTSWKHGLGLGDFRIVRLEGVGLRVGQFPSDQAAREKHDSKQRKHQ